MPTLWLTCPVCDEEGVLECVVDDTRPQYVSVMNQLCDCALPDDVWLELVDEAQEKLHEREEAP